MREIWGLQPRFERRTGRSPFRLVEHLRFRAGYDFLLLRAAADEIPVAQGDWWTRFLQASPDEREQLVVEAARESGPTSTAGIDGAADGEAAVKATQRTLFKGLSETNRIHRAGRQSGGDGRIAEGGVRLTALARTVRATGGFTVLQVGADRRDWPRLRQCGGEA